MKNSRRKALFSLVLILLAAFTAGPAAQAGADSNPVIIRDTEIENTFEGWIAPLLQAAGMGEGSVELVLVQSPQINAFVAGGANIFIYTGLIEKTENPDEVIGVMAHELGHIAGGHLINTRDAFERASYESILGAVLGIGAAIVTGKGEAANAIISGSGSMAQGRFLAHARVNESSADQAALRFLETAQMNPHGLGTFLEKLEDEELLPASQQSEYVRTHPLTRDRIDAVETRISQSSNKDKVSPEEWSRQHARMKAKLIGFISPGRVPWVYDDRDTSIPAQYARAIAAFRQNETKKALKDVDALIAAEPQNPYFQELKGQMLLGFGRVQESIPFYEKAVELMPSAGLIRIDLAHALLESGNPRNIQKAIDHLERALNEEPRSAKAHRLLATAYGRSGKNTLAKLHLAEEAVMQGRLPYAKHQAEAAQKESSQGSREWIEAQDVLDQIRRLENQED